MKTKQNSGFSSSPKRQCPAPSGREITLVMDYGQSGVITKHLVKIIK